MSTTTARGLNHLTDDQLNCRIRETVEAIENGHGGHFARSVLNVLTEETIERAKIWAEEVSEISTVWAQPWPTDPS